MKGLILVLALAGLAGAADLGGGHAKPKAPEKPDVIRFTAGGQEYSVPGDTDPDVLRQVVETVTRQKAQGVPQQMPAAPTYYYPAQPRPVFSFGFVLGGCPGGVCPLQKKQ
jgi:hypothetical protein